MKNLLFLELLVLFSCCFLQYSGAQEDVNNESVEKQQEETTTEEPVQSVKCEKPQESDRRCPNYYNCYNKETGKCYLIAIGKLGNRCEAINECTKYKGYLPRLTITDVEFLKKYLPSWEKIYRSKLAAVNLAYFYVAQSNNPDLVKNETAQSRKKRAWFRKKTPNLGTVTQRPVMDAVPDNPAAMGGYGYQGPTKMERGLGYFSLVASSIGMLSLVGGITTQYMPQPEPNRDTFPVFNNRDFNNNNKKEGRGKIMYVLREKSYYAIMCEAPVFINKNGVWKAMKVESKVETKTGESADAGRRQVTTQFQHGLMFSGMFTIAFLIIICIILGVIIYLKSKHQNVMTDVPGEEGGQSATKKKIKAKDPKESVEDGRSSVASSASSASTASISSKKTKKSNK